MSGGSYDYFFHKLESFADDLEQAQTRSPERTAFVQLVRRVGEVAHALEWDDSGDDSDSAEPAIRTLFEQLSSQDWIAQSIIDSLEEGIRAAKEHIRELKRLGVMKRAKSS